MRQAIRQFFGEGRRNVQTMTPSKEIKTKVLVISDTHCVDLQPTDSIIHAFRHPLPRADVLLHCGDLTHNGTMEQYEITLQMLKSIDAELKLVIAGNHDKTLDGVYWKNKRSEGSKLGDHHNAVGFWKGKKARDAGVTYLEEGTHQFTLKSGATFKIYASPYTPEFCNWAFPYDHNEDRFNPLPCTHPQDRNIAVNPIPDFHGVDIVMTHGPPETFLGITQHGNNAGCRHLLRAVHRARPRLHCFGHIHESWGAEVVDWAKYEDKTLPHHRISSVSAISVDETEMLENRCVKVDVSSSGETPLKVGQQTLMVNAAIMNVNYRPLNGPWLVEMDLPRAK